MLWLALGLLLAGSALADYVSRPDLKPANWNVTYLSPIYKPASGYVFLAPRIAKWSGLMIYDQDGEPVYVNNSDTVMAAFNFRPQQWKGDTVLTFWTGDMKTGGYGQGTVHIMNPDYTINITVTPSDHLLDAHEFDITMDGTATATYYYTMNNQDLTAVTAPPFNVPQAYVVMSCVAEVNITTSDMLFTWCPSDHGVNYAQSLTPPRANPSSPDTPWDWSHLNSVVKDVLGNYLVSSRHNCALYYVDGKSKNILWTLGGTESSFNGTGNYFAYQHDARFVNENGATTDDVQRRNQSGKRYVSLFDNASYSGYRVTDSQSSGKLIELDMATRTATIVQIYHDPGRDNNLLAGSQGNVQLLSNYSLLDSTNVVIGYGNINAWAEYTEDGHSVQEVRFTVGAEDYRVYKNDWVGKPTSLPDVAMKNGKVYVSWNGATGIKEWQLVQLLNSQKQNTQPNITMVPRAGFETAIAVRTDFAKMQLTALDSAGNPLGHSRVYDPSGHVTNDAILQGTKTSSAGNNGGSSSKSTGNNTKQGFNGTFKLNSGPALKLNLWASTPIAFVVGYLLLLV